MPVCNEKFLMYLSLQLGAYVIHTIHMDWTTAIQDIIAMFDPGTVSGIEPSTALNLLFSILTVIPEEVSRVPYCISVTFFFFCVNHYVIAVLNGAVQRVTYKRISMLRYCRF